MRVCRMHCPECNYEETHDANTVIKCPNCGNAELQMGASKTFKRIGHGPHNHIPQLAATSFADRMAVEHQVTSFEQIGKEVQAEREMILEALTLLRDHINGKPIPAELMHQEDEVRKARCLRLLLEFSDVNACTGLMVKYFGKVQRKAST